MGCACSLPASPVRMLQPGAAPRLALGAGCVPRFASSAQATHRLLAETRPPALLRHRHSQVVSEDYELIAEYIDAIRHLIAAAQAERPDREEVRRLSNMVLHIQEVGGLPDGWGRRAGQGGVGCGEPAEVPGCTVAKRLRTRCTLAWRRSSKKGQPPLACECSLVLQEALSLFT